MENTLTSPGLTADGGRLVLARAQRAWHDGDLQGLLDALDPNVRIQFNALAPIEGIDAAADWLAERFRTQLDYRPSKQFRGVYGNTVVGQWTGNWRESSGDSFRCIGIELLTVGNDGRITYWEAAMVKERANDQ